MFQFVFDTTIYFNGRHQKIILKRAMCLYAEHQCKLIPTPQTEQVALVKYTHGHHLIYNWEGWKRENYQKKKNHKRCRLSIPIMKMVIVSSGWRKMSGLLSSALATASASTAAACVSTAACRSSNKRIFNPKPFASTSYYLHPFLLRGFLFFFVNILASSFHDAAFVASLHNHVIKNFERKLNTLRQLLICFLLTRVWIRK